MSVEMTVFKTYETDEQNVNLHSNTFDFNHNFKSKIGQIILSFLNEKKDIEVFTRLCKKTRITSFQKYLDVCNKDKWMPKTMTQFKFFLINFLLSITVKV